MKWFKYIFASLLLLLSFPLWRLQDWAVVTLPFPTLITALMVVWSAVFVVFPLLIFFPKIKGWMGALIIPLIGSLTWLASPLSDQTTLHPEHTHCGRMTYTGLFYPMRNLLSQAHVDDLEVRNQMCWIVKMIQKVPRQIEVDDLPLQLDLMRKKLLKPNYKYRATLPWIMFLVGKHFSATDTSDSNLDKIKNSHLFSQEFAFWSDTYAESISAREYAWYEWPHSSVIKAEYGFIEENWDKIEIQSL